MRELYIRNGHGFLLVYSITSRGTISALQEIYNQITFIKEAHETAVVLVGNKCDMEESRAVPLEEAEQVAKNFKCQHITTSARNNVRVTDAFTTLVQTVIKNNPKVLTASSPSGSASAEQQKPDGKSGGCCCIV
eukprot:TRINITY_DN1508_c0_g1_i10.p1 TRINITY_DN1508_c0_g1~~TRINITY_DN1508_c0_g1_i10.p1  ORF type:complete len:134 (-),score=45.43 TRINITY_DN1508_c0_g1_i10:33-434(-)